MPHPASVLVEEAVGISRRGTRADWELSDPSMDSSIHRWVEYNRSHDFPAWTFRSGHLHGSDGFVGLVLVGMEIDEPADAFRAPVGVFSTTSMRTMASASSSR